jgi:hypothetical protein
MEGILRARAAGGWVGQRLDDLQLLDDRSRPSVRDDQRQRVLAVAGVILLSFQSCVLLVAVVDADSNRW